MPDKINDTAFFTLIDPEMGQIIADAERRRHLRFNTDFPWEHVTEDRERLKDAINARYEALGLKHPRITFARSPNAAFGALMYLRQMQTTMRQNVITAMTKNDVDQLDAEARAVFLESIIDKDLTVSLGACLRDSLLPGEGRRLRPLVQLADILRQKFTPPANGKPQPAGWRDWVVYPVEHGFNYDIQTQCFCLLAFVKAVYVSLPPLFIRTDEDGNLHSAEGPAVRFADGFEIHCQHIDHSAELALPAPKPPRGKSALQMLQEARKSLTDGAE